jgi:vitamin B12 transporter
LTNPVFWIGQYINAAKAKSRGYETEINFEPLTGLKLKTGYTYLKAQQDFVDEDFVTIFSEQTIRIPRNKAFFGLSFEHKKIDLAMDISYVGGRLDRIWKTVGFISVDEFVKLKPYLLGNLSVNYKLRENFSIFIRMNNIFNKDYETIKGYQEEKFSVLGGLKAKF